ncbi:hypothetical protein M9H77_16401 [Catharanthus roseus]|uniref:Uncharacterized protein n=1 Tax=Catharanthus roseus TaxID=4058 RepID=A0ACC0B1Y8_CATRO|nr:hypothetical protein M9H77_16401 [Catharanthus roseus]
MSLESSSLKKTGSKNSQNRLSGFRTGRPIFPKYRKNRPSDFLQDKSESFCFRTSCHFFEKVYIDFFISQILNSILPEDPGVTLTSPPEVAVTKGRKKTNSTKRDKSHWEYVSIAHRKIQKSSRSGSGLAMDLDLVGVCNWKNVVGDGNCGYRVVEDFVFGDEHQWPEVRRRMLYELEHATNMYLSLLGSAEHVHEFVHRTQWQDGPAPLEHGLETSYSLYVIANAFNLCVVLIAQLGSMTMLPLYSYSDCPGGTLVIGLLTKQQYFIQLQMHDECLIPSLHGQWIYHHSERVSNSADSYYERIEDWNARRARNIN